ncbi:MAG: HEAT repeat domain-containing protein [Deltaproteobacteria bacterium]|nr:HEAT repeat domain-containing protein [Deltaproteobacteria bacterium]
MNTSCPTCSKAVDPVRARHVRVRDGKVVAYCSPGCEQAAETKPTAIPKAQPFALDSGPVIEIVRSRDDAEDDADSKGSPKVGVNLAEMRELDRKHGRAPTPLPIRPGRKAPLIIVLVLLVGGAGALVAYKYLFSNRDVSASTQGARTDAVAVPVPPPVVPAAPPAPTAADSVTRALGILATNLDSQSPRVQRVAAAALSRTGDPKAIGLLATALTKETSDIIKLDIAYALARAGDKRGRAALVAGLGSGRRDIKAAAGRSLALLGDARAAQGLAPYLGVTQLRLGAAEALAYLADPKAVAVLDQLRSAEAGADDAKTSPDDRARATIALGFAGRTDVIPELHKLLDDPRFNAFAAHALAKLGDPAARPVLLDQLAIPSLRVDAARSLRVLEPAFDATPHLPALLAALGSLKDTEQVQVAEAILLLAGEATWSERP